MVTFILNSPIVFFVIVIVFLLALEIFVLRYNKYRKKKRMEWPKKCKDKKVEAIIAQLKYAWSQHDGTKETEFCRGIDYVAAQHESILGSMRKWPEKVVVSADNCPTCGTSIVSFYYSYPTIAWKNLAGRAGTMTICTKCGKALSFKLEKMN